MNGNIPKRLQVKKEHHYVWASYLRNWSSDKKVWFLTAKGKVIHESTKMVAKERFFYKVHHLTDKHVACIVALSKLSSDDFCESHLALLDELLSLQTLLELAKADEGTSDDAFRELQCLYENWLEDKYTEQEVKVKSIISKIAKGNLHVLSINENLAKFLHFLGHQLARTKAFRELSYKTINSMPLRFENQEEIAKVSHECRWLSSYIIGDNIGASLYLTKERNSICLFVNKTSEPLITGDSPVVNINKMIGEKPKLLSEDQCDLYYPISYKYAIVVSCSNDYPSGRIEIDLNDVISLNEIMARNANAHIFSSQEKVLHKYKKFVGSKCGNLDFSDFYR